MSVYEIRVNGQMLGKDMLNMYYCYHPTMSPTILQSFIAALYDCLLDIATWQSDDYTSGSYTVRRVDIGDQPAVEGPWPDIVQGAKPDDILAPQLAMLVLTYANSARPNKGRKYLGGFAEGATATNNWVAAAQGAVLGAYQDLIAFGAGSGGSEASWVIPHWVGPTPGSPDTLRHVSAQNPIYTVRIVPETRTQRRRTQGRGS